jgi:hypothetical protein
MTDIGQTGLECPLYDCWISRASIWVIVPRTVAMERFVAQHNISHFEQLLRNEAAS